MWRGGHLVQAPAGSDGRRLAWDGGGAELGHQRHHLGYGGVGGGFVVALGHGGDAAAAAAVIRVAADIEGSVAFLNGLPPFGDPPFWQSNRVYGTGHDGRPTDQRGCQALEH